jgi:hypothetical protein
MSFFEKHAFLIKLVGWSICLIIAIDLVTTYYAKYTLYDQAHTQEQSQQDIIYNSAWDGSVQQVNDWFDDNLNDPSSLQVVEWGQVIKSPEGNFMVRCKYRAKNAVGALMLNEDVFYFTENGRFAYKHAFDAS